MMVHSASGYREMASRLKPWSNPCGRVEEDNILDIFMHFIGRYVFQNDPTEIRRRNYGHREVQIISQHKVLHRVQSTTVPTISIRHAALTPP